jgi:hypothetical protein
MYHTQEKRATRLSAPIICDRNDAWLGSGYYFWDEEIDAIHWGHKSKRQTGYFEIYSADINCEDVLDTVFNEEHYKFWRKQIEKVAAVISKKTGSKATLNELNAYIAEKAKWAEVVTGILFQDLPNSADLLVAKLNYRKRIQIAVYDITIIKTFVFHDCMKCN